MHFDALEEISVRGFKPGIEAQPRTIRNHQAGLREICKVNESHQPRTVIVFGRVSEFTDRLATGPGFEVASQVLE